MSIFSKIDKKVLLSKKDLMVIPVAKTVKYFLITLCLVAGLVAIYFSM